MINSFVGKYEFLSNSYECGVSYNGVTYKSSESAYQAQKTMDMDEREMISYLSAGDAYEVGNSIFLRYDWEDVKEEIMYEVIKEKFSSNSMREMLLSTGNNELVAENTWSDTYWGTCEGEGENVLGKILMKVRDELVLEKEGEALLTNGW